MAHHHSGYEPDRFIPTTIGNEVRTINVYRSRFASSRRAVVKADSDFRGASLRRLHRNCRCGASSPNKRKKCSYIGGEAAHRSSDDALPHLPGTGSDHAAASVSGLTSMAEQPGVTTDSNDSRPRPSYPAR